MAGKHQSDYSRERDRLDLAARKVAQEKARDEPLEQCVIAYSAHVAGCGCSGHMRWADFRADWFRQRGIMEEQKLGR